MNSIKVVKRGDRYYIHYDNNKDWTTSIHDSKLVNLADVLMHDCARLTDTQTGVNKSKELGEV